MTPLPQPLRWLLLVLPARFRERHAREIASLLASHAREGGGAQRRGVWVHGAIDIVRTGLALRLRPLTGGPGGVTAAAAGTARDLRFAGRTLGRNPGFTIVAVLTLAVGIGATTAMFSVVHGVLLRPLPYRDADRIGILWHQFGEDAQNLPLLNPLDLRDYRDRSTRFEDATMATGSEWILGDEDDAELVDVAQVEAGFFDFFGATPVLGRAFRAEEDVPGAATTVILSHRLWERRFGADPGVVGRTILLEGESATVVGVAPAWFRLYLSPQSLFLRDAEVFVPVRLDPAAQPVRTATFFTGFVRLREGVTFAQAQEELDALAATLRAEHPVHAAANLRARVVPLLTEVVKEASGTLTFLMGAVGFVLLIACANVANLVLVRGQDRGRELAIRAALGSGRAGLVRLVLTESLLLALTGAAAGALLAFGALELVIGRWSATVPRLETVTIDPTVLAFLAGVTVLSTVLFGLPAALRSSRLDPAQTLAADARGGPDRAHAVLRNALVVAQVTASLVLLIGTGLMLRSAMALLTVDPGYDLHGTLTFRVSLPPAAFPDPASRIAMRAALIDELTGAGGIESIAAINQLPLTGAGGVQPYAYDAATAANWETASADGRFVTPGYFDTIGARLIAGRDFVSSDFTDLNAVIVDDQLAAQAFPAGDAVGKELQLQPSSVPRERRYGVIVGVVRHLRIHRLTETLLPQIYRPLRASTRFSVVMRTTGAPTDALAAARATIARLAPGAPVQDVRTIEELAADTLAPSRLALYLMTGFGLIAVLLACVGLYGVLAYAVNGRTREIGIRLALGQTPAGVRRLVLRDGGRLVAVAVALGLASAALLTRALSGLIFGVQPLDPLTYGAATVVLVLIAVAACWLPARRAIRVDPAVALRES